MLIHHFLEVKGGGCKKVAFLFKSGTLSQVKATSVGNLEMHV